MLSDDDNETVVISKEFSEQEISDNAGEHVLSGIPPNSRNFYCFITAQLNKKISYSSPRTASMNFFGQCKKQSDATKNNKDRNSNSNKGEDSLQITS